jgi:hypothetical protein
MAIRNGTSPGKGSTTGVKYLNIDKGYLYVARVQIKGKHFVVWKGVDKSIGVIVARKIQELMLKGEGVFLEWFDYDKDEWLEKTLRKEDGNVRIL